MGIEFIWALSLCVILLLERVWLRRRLYFVKEETKRLKDKLDYRNFVSAEIAHDIKNPLTAILCSTEALELITKDILPDSERQTLRCIREYGEHLRRLVSDFLDISLIESGKIPVNPHPTSIKLVVDSVIGLLSSTASRKGVTIEFSSSDSDLEVSIDPKHFKQIIFNLTHNAIKFAPDKSSVEIEVSCRTKDRATITIVDHGVGIPADLVPHIFQLWSVSKKDLTHLGGGVGIGLSLVKHLVELAKGEISLESVRGRTAFQVALNIAHRPTEKFSGQGRCLEGKKILIVQALGEGDVSPAANVARVLGAVVTATRGVERAVLELKDSSFDSILVDECGDKGFGLAFSRIVKKDLGLKETNIVVLSDESEQSALSEEFLVDKWLVVPVTPERALEALR